MSLADTAWPVIVRHLSQTFGREIVARYTNSTAIEVESWERGEPAPAIRREGLMRLLAAHFILELRQDLDDLEDLRDRLLEDGRRIYGDASATSGRRRGGGGKYWRS